MLAASTCLGSYASSADYFVTSALDSGSGSLRDIIGLANLNSGQVDTIRFDSSLAGQTINISSMLPMIAKSSEESGTIY